MSHTNVTPNYNLPQYVGTDIINPLTDTNDAYSAIDTAMKDIADGVSGGASKIEALETTVGDADSGLVKSVADLQTQNGDISLSTTAQTLSGAINELDGEVSTNTGNISTLVQKVGSDTLDTDATTCTGAINEIVGQNAILSQTFTGDGVKTVNEISRDITTFLSTIASANPTKKIKIVGATVVGSSVKPDDELYLDNNTDFSNFSMVFSGVKMALGSQTATVSRFIIQSAVDTVGTYIYLDISASNVTFHDITNGALTATQSIVVKYQLLD